jgi:hypothetical protein
MGVFAVAEVLEIRTRIQLQVQTSIFMMLANLYGRVIQMSQSKPGYALHHVDELQLIVGSR